MVSKARLDLPEPERPVTTMRLLRGSSTEMFFKLCTRAPWTAMVVRGALTVRLAEAVFVALDLELIWRPCAVEEGGVEEGRLFDGDVAMFGEAQRQRSLADDSLVGQVLTNGSEAGHTVGALKVMFNLFGGAGFAHFFEVFSDHGE